VALLAARAWVLGADAVRLADTLREARRVDAVGGSEPDLERASHAALRAFRDMVALSEAESVGPTGARGLPPGREPLPGVRPPR
jgi:hypothetical protein